MTDIQQVRKGSTPLLILRILTEQPLHGYAMMRELEKRSEGYFNMTAALLYPTLHQMEQDGLVEANWEAGSGQRRRKVYAITPRGQEHLQQGQKEWQRFFEQLFGVLDHPAKIQREE